jgi:hypothetical protein
VQEQWQSEPSTRAVWVPRTAVAERTIRLNASRDGLELKGCTTHLRRTVPFALAALSERVNKGTLLQARKAGSRIPVIPQLTADTMRHDRTTCAVPHGKNEENEETRAFGSLAARLKGSNVSAGAEMARSTRPHLFIHRLVPTPRD